MLDTFAGEMRIISVVQATAGAYVDGEWQESTDDPVDVRMIAIPITPAQLRNLPEGAYQAGDMRFYHRGAPAYQPGDRFIINGITYRVRDITDRSFEGNFTIYLAKRDYENQ